MISPSAQKLTTDNDRSIGTRITALRKARGITQTALGQALGVSFQQVQKYEKGRNRVGAGRLQTIADHLGVPVSTFFDNPAADNAGQAMLWDLLEDQEVLELVRTFLSISDKTVRRNVLSILRAAATLQLATVNAPD